ncbi:MAG: cupredoxin domain-containing protein [Patescibacteria group bacterium]
MKNLIYVFLLLIILAGGWYYLKPKAQVVPAQSVKLDQSASPVAVPANFTVIKMAGENFRFSPDTITVKKGQPIRITLTSVDMPHNFVVDELGVKGEIFQPGQTGNTDFTPDKIGEFEFYCAVGQHRQKGMVGKLKVID